MSKFTCKNNNCKRFGRTDEYFKNSYKFNSEGRLVSTNAPCPACGKERVEDSEGAKIPVAEKGISMPKYSSMNKKQQQEVLKKRSHDHFNKKVKPFKEHQLNEAMRQFKETGKP